jgi:hypothetical protein
MVPLHITLSCKFQLFTWHQDENAFILQCSISFSFQRFLPEASLGLGVRSMEALLGPRGFPFLHKATR